MIYTHRSPNRCHVSAHMATAGDKPGRWREEWRQSLHGGWQRRKGWAGYREAEVGWLMEGTAELGPQDVPSGWALVKDGARQMWGLCTGKAGLAGEGLTSSRN